MPTKLNPAALRPTVNRPATIEETQFLLAIARHNSGIRWWLLEDVMAYRRPDICGGTHLEELEQSLTAKQDPPVPVLLAGRDVGVQVQTPAVEKKDLALLTADELTSHILTLKSQLATAEDEIDIRCETELLKKEIKKREATVTRNKEKNLREIKRLQDVHVTLTSLEQRLVG